MALFLTETHQAHLSFLNDFKPEVLATFAQAAIDYIKKGPNQKSYTTAAERFNVSIELIQDAVESLVYIFVECNKFEITEDEIKNLLAEAGFDEQQTEVLKDLYQNSKHLIHEICMKSDNFMYFYDLRWRFEAKIGSRSILNQMTPLVTMNFKFADSPKAATVNKQSNCLLQTDPNTLMRITETLEKALVLSRSRNMKKVERRIKKIIPED